MKYYVLIILSLFLLFTEQILTSPYNKVLGFVLIMFSVYNLQKRVPHKTEQTDFVVTEKENKDEERR